jgi:hypothetical protein
MQKFLSFGRADSYISMMQFSTLPFVQSLLRLTPKGRSGRFVQEVLQFFMLE